jgi:hypothetical protein
MKTKSKPKKVKLMSLVSVSGRWVAPWEGDDGSTVIAWGLDAAGGVHGVVVDDAAGTIAVLGTTGRFQRVGT